MRRFASVFASKREKLLDPSGSVKRTATLDTNPPPLVPDHANSSASSSSGSASLKTPDDDHLRISSSLRPKKSWKSWLKVRTVKHPTDKWDSKPIPDWPPQPHIPHDFDEQDDFVSDESDALSIPLSQNAPSICLPVPPSSAQAQQIFRQIVDNSLISPPSCSPFIQRSDTSLVFPRSCNPARDLSRESTMLSSMLKTRLCRRLGDSSRRLNRTEQRDIAPLGNRQMSTVAASPTSELPFDEPAPWNKTWISLSSPGLHRWRSRPCFEDRYVVFTPTDEGVFFQRVTGTALAVASLEYSEAIDAMAGYVDDVAPSPSLVTSFTPEVLLSETRTAVQTLPPLSSSSQPPSPTHTRNAPYIAVPSPLRNEHSPVISPAVSAPIQVPEIALTGVDPPVKRGVRFAEDEKDDVIPLGYVLRMKRKREEKARFLRAEHDRRVLEEQRVRLEAERRMQEAERSEWEKERQAWERERKAEEERKQRMYTEEIVATRLRREAARAGGVPSSNNGTVSSLMGPEADHFPSSASSTSLRDLERNRLLQPMPRGHRGMVYDLAMPPSSASLPVPRRAASERNLPTITTTSASIAHSPPPSSSPESSRTPSVGDGHSTPSLIASGSGSGTRPPSMYSSIELSSAEDVRQQRAAAAANMNNRSKRNSLATSTSSLRLNPDRASSFPGWGGNNLSLNYVSAVPMIPAMVPAYVMMDMPLLPPTAPFMLHQYPRQQQAHGSSGPASSRGRLSSSGNSSRERDHLPQGQEGQHLRSSSQNHHRPDYRHSSSSPPTSGSALSSRGGTHHRHGSGDSRRASMPPQLPNMQQVQSGRPRLNSQHSHGRPAVPRSYSGTPASHGVPPSPQHLQLPSPWTGLPSQSGKPPAGMPVPKSQSHSNLRSGRRRTLAS